MKLLGIERFAAFLEAVQSDCSAARFANEELQEGRSAEDLFSTANDSGYSLSVTPLGEHRFLIEFGCSPGPLVGDGGEWDVSFRSDGTVDSVTPGGFWVS